MRANQTSYFSTIAVNLGQDKLEELKANPADLVSAPGTDTVPADGVDFTRSWTTSTLVAGVTQIDVTVSWTDYTTHNVTVSSAVLN
jgi:hypothetical protein